MGKVSIGINIEFVRHADKSFEWGSVSMLDDPLRIRNAAEQRGLKISALSAHSPLCHPEISTDYLRQAVRFAHECGAPCVITDDGARRPGWASLAENQTLMRCVLEAATDAAETRNIVVALETHGEYTATPDQLAATLALVNSPALAINFDTGNSFLSGNDPCAWLESIIDRVVHVHAKDISHENARLYRGKVRGMLGCACGDGVIHWERLVRTCERAPRDLVLSVECDTIEDAQRSPEQLSAIAANE